MRETTDRTLPLKLGALAAAMFVFGFAVLPPLYDVFCELTGYGGKTANDGAIVVGQPDPTRTVHVEFVASRASGAPWEFAPAVAHLDVHPGEVYSTTYRARNLTAAPLVGRAVPSVAPGDAAQHFKKLECFCFTAQSFEPSETRDLRVVFVVDPALPAYTDTVTLSYTLFAAAD
jgi:cytochrome c oxidase assembly protein subunit 11